MFSAQNKQPIVFHCVSLLKQLAGALLPPAPCRTVPLSTAVPTLGWAWSRRGSTQLPASSCHCCALTGLGGGCGGIWGGCCRSLWPPAHNFPRVICSGFVILQNTYTSALFFSSTCFLHRCCDSLLTHTAILLHSLPQLCPAFCSCCCLHSHSLMQQVLSPSTACPAPSQLFWFPHKMIETSRGFLCWSQCSQTCC